MSSPAGPLKASIEAALRGSTALSTAMGGSARLYTEAPTNVPLPYVLLGEDLITFDGGGCATEADASITVHYWSSNNDKGAQARAIGSAMIGVLNAQLAVTGWDVDEWTVEVERYVTDPDGSTHGVLTMRYLLTQQAA